MITTLQEAGLIISNLTVFGVMCKRMTRILHAHSNSRCSWDSFLTLSVESIRELTFWENSVGKLNFRSLQHTLLTRVVCSDASDTGCAAFISLDDDPVFHLERIVVFSRRVKEPCFQLPWNTDNQAVVSIVYSGSMKLTLHQLALDIFYHAKDNNIEVDIEWIP
jgi:hypothetical protein